MSYYRRRISSGKSDDDFKVFVCLRKDGFDCLGDISLAVVDRDYYADFGFGHFSYYLSKGL